MFSLRSIFQIGIIRILLFYFSNPKCGGHKETDGFIGLRFFSVLTSGCTMRYEEWPRRFSIPILKDY